MYLRQEVWQDLFLGITRALLTSIGLLLLEPALLLTTIPLVGGISPQRVLQQLIPSTHQFLCLLQTALVLEELELLLHRLLLLLHIYITAEQVRNVLVLEIAVITEEVLTIKQVVVLVIILLVAITTLEPIQLACPPRELVVRQTFNVALQQQSINVMLTTCHICLMLVTLLVLATLQVTVLVGSPTEQLVVHQRVKINK